MANKAPDWKRLGRYVVDRRASLGMTQEQLTAAGGPSTASLRLIEGALQESYRPHTLAALERALGWAAGSVDAVLHGREPEVVHDPARGSPVVPDSAESTHTSSGDDTVLMHLPPGALAGLGPAEREEALSRARATWLQTAREIRRQQDS